MSDTADRNAIEAKLADLDAAVARSLAEADAGLGLPAHDVFAELKARYRIDPPHPTSTASTGRLSERGIAGA
ncbi:hypothetical protein [Salinarimonas rosea]|uniref:hypothetical protein n=1 Tax=Salinarimonas rosea TaxID=552063 RepID=UPI0005B77223|nr:hypothetical protein [Salinarimonas rosea]